MATFAGNAAGYQIDVLGNGKVRVLDIDPSDGDTGQSILSNAQTLKFDDKSYELSFLSNGTGIRVDATDGDDIVNGGAGVQQIFGGAGDDTLNGGMGDDKLDGGSGYDTLNGGAGNDILRGGEWGSDTLRGGDGDDTLYARASAGYLYGGDGDDHLESDKGFDTLNGGAGDDYLSSGSRNDTLQGGDGNDELYGGYGNDRLEGGAGNDILYGTLGNTDLLLGGDGDDTMCTGGSVYGSSTGTMTGGAGSDNFLIIQSYRGYGFDSSTITDFSSAQGDKIQLDNMGKLSVAGDLNPDFFVANAGGEAMDADDYVVYDTDTGKLYYDPDGNGAGAKLELAVLIGKPALTAADIEAV